ncbi:hypothetical protein EJ04DRAFT_601223 [Polyplosphaeria fusca]|uniref:Uncharacterized protein n=1 Tax=Polyplosphaeria fusca TaxID=682080 RepID=A0A9P4V0H5_9PLEO|nr:hypothetical protein EJ04DRAFT_601223 [Polyplosphaeria fusca]
MIPPSRGSPVVERQAIERLLRQVTSEQSREIKKEIKDQIRLAVHKSAIRTELVLHENERLKEALHNEKKRRQRGKPLLLQRPDTYAGGAVFWSPKKVQEARDRQVKQDAEKQLQQQQKEEEQEQWQRKKEDKAVQLEQRRQDAAAAKHRRMLQKQDEALQHEEKRIARDAEKQLRKDMREALKGKPRRAKAKQ